MNRRFSIATGAALAVIALAAVALTRLHALQRLGQPGLRIVPQNVTREDGTLIGTNTVALPEAVPGFESRSLPIAKVVSDWLPRDTTYAQRMYEAPDHFRIQTTVVVMGSDRTSIHQPEYCLTGQGFQTMKSELDRIRIRKPHPYDLPVRRMTLTRTVTTPDGGSGRHSAVFVYWFVADGQLTADHRERMWWLARDLVTRGVLERWAYVSCFAACPTGEEEKAYARIREWIQASVPQFQSTTGPANGLARTP